MSFQPLGAETRTVAVQSDIHYDGVVLSLIPFVVLSSPKEFRVLFLGNSHTAANNLTQLVKSLSDSDGSGRIVTVKVEFAPLLNDFANIPKVREEIRTGAWSAIVLQGAAMSSSHQYSYSQERGISVAKLAISSGSPTYLFAEWPRRGWDETGYILGIYSKIAKASGATIIPVPRCWDVALRHDSKLDLWSPDGNHSSPTGAYLAACGIYYGLFGTKGNPTYTPTYLTAATAKTLRSWAREGIVGSTQTKAAHT